MKRILLSIVAAMLMATSSMSLLASCSKDEGQEPVTPAPTPEVMTPTDLETYIDSRGDTAYIPAGFTVSDKPDERAINTGLVVIGPDGSEFVWILPHTCSL